MLSKYILDAMRDEFNNEYGELSQKDSYIKEMKANASALIGSMAPNDPRLEFDVEDALVAIESAASLLGFFIGLKTGADMMQSLPNGSFPEKVLEAFGELDL